MAAGESDGQAIVVCRGGSWFDGMEKNRMRNGKGDEMVNDLTAFSCSLSILGTRCERNGL